MSALVRLLKAPRQDILGIFIALFQRKRSLLNLGSPCRKFNEARFSSVEKSTSFKGLPGVEFWLHVLSVCGFSTFLSPFLYFLKQR